MADDRENASRPGAVACVGDWRSRGKAIKIVERDGYLLLEMGADAPVLALLASSEGVEVWPMQWKAVWRPPPGETPQAKDPLYIIELSTPTSSRLLVKRPIGDGTVEFTRVSAAMDRGPRERSRSRSRRSRSRTGKDRSRSRSRSGSARKGGTGNFLPGDWNCPRCGDHQFARNLSCRSCGASKPKQEEVAKSEPQSRDGLVMQIKRGQRESHSFKERWWEHCDKHGNGFYDPVRHETKFLEEFMEKENKGGHAVGGGGKSRSKSGSGSHSGSRSASSKSRRSASSGGRRGRKRRKRSRGGGRRRRRRRHKDRRHSRRRRKDRRKKRKASRSRSRSRPSRSSSSNSSVSGLPSRDAAIKAAEQSAREAEQVLEREREALAKMPIAADSLRDVEEAHREEVARKVEKAQKQADEDFQKKLEEAEEKLQEEKVARLREAEQRLDKAIASRLKEAEKKLRRDAETQVEDAKKEAERAFQEAMDVAEDRLKEEASEKVKAAEERLRQARERVASVKKADGGADSDGSSSGSSGSDSEPNGKG
mmetsp:Transcript_88048/g.247489  ORF Transcript_88048/g.247489 Transcript_88048/m.247489 type:complete len:538 (-) Transcript_88048:64-1677(-)